MSNLSKHEDVHKLVVSCVTDILQTYCIINGFILGKQKGYTSTLSDRMSTEFLDENNFSNYVNILTDLHKCNSEDKERFTIDVSINISYSKYYNKRITILFSKVDRLQEVISGLLHDFIFAER